MSIIKLVLILTILGLIYQVFGANPTCTLIYTGNNQVTIYDVNGDEIFDTNNGFQSPYTTIPRKCNGQSTTPYTICVECANNNAAILQAGFYSTTTNPPDTSSGITTFGGTCLTNDKNTQFCSTASLVYTLPKATDFFIAGITGSGESSVFSEAGTGDPHFLGLKKQWFEFQGKPNAYFNIFSDPYISVNALFSPWYHNNTYMTAIGVRTKEFDFGIKFENKKFTFEINNITTLISSSHLIHHRGGCYDIRIENFTMTITSPAHIVTVKLLKSIYLDYGLEFELPPGTSLGGIIGQTDNDTFNYKSLIIEDFIESSLTSTSSPKNVFAEFDECKITVNENSFSRNSKVTSFIVASPIITSM